jgi:DNA repair protein RadD
MQLRPYQQKAVDLLYNYFQHNAGNPVLEAPTGAGKSVIQASFIKSAVDHFPQTRVIALTHVRELIQQNAMALHRAYPGGDIGIHSASLGARDTRRQIIFGGIQSVARRVNELGYFDLAFIDECHLVPHKNAGQYRETLDRLRLFNPKLKVIGFTATPYRLGGGLLTEGDDRLFTDLISAESAGMSIGDLLDMGYLAPLTTAPVATHLSTEGVGTSKGDYVASQLERAVTADGATERACDEVIRFGHDRKGWLLFATTVAHGERIEAYLREAGVSIRLITGTTPDGVRSQIIDQYKRGDIRALVNVGVLTTGFDAPHTDLLAFLRPTKSPVLYQQMAGRGMRTATGKTDCLVLDFADNIAQHGPVDNVRPPKRRGKSTQPAPMRECDQCRALMPTSTRECPGCGKVFEIQRSTNISDKASALAILSSDIKPEVVEPTRYRVSVHSKPGKPDSLKVDWYAGLRRVASEWVCLLHSGYAKEKADQWWRDHVGGEIPATIEDAINRAERDLRLPSEISISLATEYPRIVGRSFEERGKAA